MTTDDARTALAGQRANGRWSMSLTRFLARALARALMRIRVDGLERVPAPALLAVNHSAFIDGPLVYGTLRRPAAFFIKVEAFTGPIGILLRHIRQIPVRRGTAEREPLAAALDTLSAGGVVGIFPEGTRGSGEVTRVEHGIAYLALRSGCPVVPVACVGTADVFPVRWWPFRRRTLVRVVFGDPFPVDAEATGRSRHTVAEAAERIRARLAEHVATTDPAD